MYTRPVAVRMRAVRGCKQVRRVVAVGGGKTVSLNLARAVLGCAINAGAIVENPKTLGRLWKLRWDNDQKEGLLWRLALNGYPGFPMHRTQLERGQPAATCPCGAHMNEGDRRHLFWECTMAVALREAIDASLDFDGLVDRTRGVGFLEAGKRAGPP